MASNFFDRFDIAPDADLTTPQGGMDQPRTRAELDRAAPKPAPTPAMGSNYFDRFDQAGAISTPAPSPSLWDRLPSTQEVGRQLKMGVGHVVDGAGAALGFFANPVNTVANAVLPGDPFSTRVGEGWSEQLGLPQPQNRTERLVKDTAVAGAGGLFTAGGAEAGILATKAPGIAGSFMRFLAEAPVVNTVAGASGGLSQGAAREAGYGEVGQTVAALAGGLAGGVAAARLGRPRAPGMPPEELVDGALDGEILPPQPGGLPSTMGQRPAFWGSEPEPIIIDQPGIGMEPSRALPAPPPRIAGPDPRLPAPPPQIEDLRGDFAQPANSNRPAPGGRANPIETPDVITPQADPAEMANIGSAIERIRAVLSGDPSVRADLLTRTAPPRGPADVWSRLGARPDIANDLDLPAVPSRPLMLDTPGVVPPAAGIGSRSRMVDITRSTESGGRRFAADGSVLTSPKGARGEMQVMPATARDPGYGVRPSNGSLDDDARVGRDLLAAYTDHFGGDPAKGWAAYNGGVGRVERQIAQHGDAWLEHMPAETQAYVAKNMKALGGAAPVSAPEGPSISPEVPSSARATAEVPSQVPTDGTVARAIDEMQPPVARDPVQVQDRVDAADPFPSAARTVTADERVGLGGGGVRETTSVVGRDAGGQPALLSVAQEPAAGRGLPDDVRGREAAAPADPAGRTAAARARAPEDALTFLAKRGGLRDDEGHALRTRSRGQGGGSRDIPQFAPGGGHLFRKAGMSIDDAGELLHEAGYFPERPTTSEVLDMLDRSVVDRQYRPEDMPAIEAARAERENDLWLEQTHDELQDVAAQHSTTIGDHELEGMRRFMAEGRTADDAFTAYHEHELAIASNHSASDTADTFYDAPEQAGGSGFEPVPAEADRAVAGGAERPARIGGDQGADTPVPAGGGARPQGREAEFDRLPGEQSDAFGQRPGDQRRALERAGEGRQRSNVGQKPPGSDGGLFDDNAGRQQDLLTFPPSDPAPGAPKVDRAKMTPAERARLIREGKWDGAGGDAGFITADMLLAPFRAAGKLLFDPEFLKGDAQAAIAAIARGMKNPKAVMTGTADRLRAFGEVTAYSTDSAIRSISDRFNSPTLAKMADLFHAEAGVTDKTTTRTFGEAVTGNTGRFMSQLDEALKPFRGNDPAMGRIRDLLTTPTTSVRAAASERAAAAKIRDLLNDVLEYRRDAGEAIGEVKDGYFPRQMRQDRVFADPTKFLQAAERAYRDIGAPDPAKAAQAYLQRNIDGHLGIEDGVGAGAPGASSAKAREFGKAADAHLRDFYDTNPLSALTSHISGAVKRAEETRRFGIKGRENSPERLAWKQQHGDQTQWAVMKAAIQDELRANGERSPGLMDRIEALRTNSLGKARMGSPRVGAAVSVVHAWNQLSTLARAMIASIPEISMGFVRGGPRYGVPHMVTTMTEVGRLIRRAPPSDAARYAEAVGAIGSENALHLLRARADDPTANAATGKILDQFYRKNGLEAWTRAGRTAAVKTAQRFVDVLAHDIESTNARVSNRAAGYLRELGISDPKGFAAAIRANTPSPADLLGDTGHAAEYATALLRFANQTVLMPTRSVKPSWASHPIGSFIMALQSYSYAFKKNVLDRVGRETMGAVKERDPAKLAAASGLVVLTGTTALVQGLRHVIFGSPVNSDQDTPLHYALETMDRTGLFGAASPLFNAFNGLKYQRGLGESLQGSVLGRVSQGVTGLAAPLVNDNPDTDAAERKAAGAFYDLVVNPAESAIGASVLRGAAGSAVILGHGVRNDDGLLPADRSTFVDAVGGADPNEE
ncbi:transglycosylase SLT domain-containing protein [Sphingomonas sp. RP10(2022)]|uniref:Transglycosylase SLT domain-containing protein n=1 Tax=Sphingomonas liriopis TaxID=2949094 RepID=A0A9X2I0K6_9SPHN|nr:transglycosylase SLT domain-containing protein [Sphingomonas liriopis]MCP3735615.1 transglycosylase SLT domain-containing protein [Sphingomonas liriopis]